MVWAEVVGLGVNGVEGVEGGGLDGSGGREEWREVVFAGVVVGWESPPLLIAD